MAVRKVIISMFEYLLDLLLCLLDVLLIFELMNRSYGKIPARRSLLYGIMIGLTFLCVSWYHYTGEYVNPFFDLAVYLCLLGFYPSSFKKKLLFSIALISLQISVLLLLNDITNILPKGWIMYGLIGYHVLFWLVLYLSMRFSEKAGRELTPLLWALLSTIPLMCAAATPFTLLLSGYYSGPLREAALYHLPLQLIFLLINLIVFVLFSEFTKFYSRSWENALLQQQVAYQKRRYKDLEAANKEVRELRHEMKNHLKTAAYLYKQGSQSELADYLQETLDRLTDIDQVITTGHLEIDALLNIKLRELEETGASCSADILIPSDLALPFTDMVVILGNLFDNAGEACETLPAAQRHVSFTMRYTEGCLWINMKNPYDVFSTVTKKQDRLSHGLGLKNIEKTVQKYNGTLAYSAQDHIFSVDLILYIGEPRGMA